MNFSDALVFLKQGQKMRRFGWSNDKLHLMLIPKNETNTPEDLLLIEYPNDTVDHWFELDDELTTDILAEDWMVIG